MKTSLAAALLSAVTLGAANPLLLPRAATCNADNCARAVTGTSTGSRPLASRIADCSSFFKITITPAPVTSTVTTTATIAKPVTVTTTTIFVGDPAKRDIAATGPVTVSPTAVPSYASACSGTSRYSSACSCAGVTKSTSTAATPTLTSTRTVTAYSTVVVGATKTIGPGPRPSCASTVQAGGDCGCLYDVTCGSKVSGGKLLLTRSLLTEFQCLDLCDTYANCFKADYSRATGVCELYTGGDGTTVFTGSDDTFTWTQTTCPDEPPQGCGFAPTS